MRLRQGSIDGSTVLTCTICRLSAANKYPVSATNHGMKDGSTFPCSARTVLSGPIRKARKGRPTMSHIGCPICVTQTASDGMVQLSDGTQVCKKCGHVIFPSESGFQCECIHCIELRNPSPPTAFLAA